ncbi:PEP-CTERM sorting domain-containing protein [Pseudoduganella sp. FT26W]|uniref:PEP-CTERM sorting domain-containing protein n=1 Tax=Duganella aquatilis TaxID=2666082 RepID=A0A844CYF4_9BURK|nr:PEP-CTERM sorting domain-containing protein [Duganella aquatilis]MRW85847.1 PEP-CTERM sorting domain-containing protein [Duganella aquatilis]
MALPTSVALTAFNLVVGDRHFNGAATLECYALTTAAKPPISVLKPKLSEGNMKNFIQVLVALAAILMLHAPAHALSELNSPIDPKVIVTVGDLQWVWSGPCAPVEPSCGTSMQRDNFTIPTAAQWLSSFADTATVVAAFTTTPFTGICASPWFNTALDHCDLMDLQMGSIWNAPSPIGTFETQNAGAEAFLVRVVPEPETYLMLVAGLGLVAAIARRKRST